MTRWRSFSWRQLRFLELSKEPLQLWSETRATQVPAVLRAQRVMTGMPGLQSYHQAVQSGPCTSSSPLLRALLAEHRSGSRLLLTSTVASPPLASNWAPAEGRRLMHLYDRLVQQQSLSGSACSVLHGRRWHGCAEWLGAQRPFMPLAQRAFSSQSRSAAEHRRQQLQKKSTEQGLYMVALVVAMIGLTYASVPLYRYNLLSSNIASDMLMLSIPLN